MSRSDKIEKVGFGTEPRWDASFLVELAQVIIIVRVVAHRFPARRLVCRRKPKGSETCLCDGWQFRFNESPPLMFAVLCLGTIPIKCLQHHTHNSVSFWCI